MSRCFDIESVIVFSNHRTECFIDFSVYLLVEVQGCIRLRSGYKASSLVKQVSEIRRRIEACEIVYFVGRGQLGFFCFKNMFTCRL